MTGLSSASVIRCSKDILRCPSAWFRVSTILAAFLGTLLLLAGVPSTAQAQAVYYVRVGATGAGTGADWTNAFTSLPASLVRGATYYVAAGVYGGYYFNTPPSGTQPIIIKRATGSDHGTSAGWHSSYGSGQASFGPLFFATSYWVFDGQIRNDADWSDLTGYGFRVVNSATSPAIGTIQIGSFSTVVTNITIRRTAVIGSSNLASTTNADDGVRYFSPCCDHAHRSLFTEIAVVRPGRDLFALRGPDDLVIERSYLAQNKHATTSQHSQGISASEHMHRFTVRHNWFEDIREEAPLTTAGVNKTGAGASSHWYFYGNVISRTLAANTGCARGAGIRIFNNSEHFGAMYVYNNTVVNARAGLSWCYGLEGRLFAVEASNTSQATIRVQNNLTWNSIGYTTGSSGWSHNAYLSMVGTHTANDAHAQVERLDPFESVEARSFHLLVDTAPGLFLPAPYDTDMYGHQRGAHGHWNRGAIERATSSTAAPQAPSNLRIEN